MHNNNNNNNNRSERKATKIRVMNWKKSLKVGLKVGHLVHLGGRIDYEVHAGRGVHRNSAESDESVNTVICAAVQTRAVKQRELKTPKPLKVSSINGLDICPEQLIEQQRSDETLRRY